MKKAEDLKFKEAMTVFRKASAFQEDVELVRGRVLFSPSLNRISVLNSAGGVEIYNKPKLSMVAHIVKNSLD